MIVTKKEVNRSKSITYRENHSKVITGSQSIKNRDWRIPVKNLVKKVRLFIVTTLLCIPGLATAADNYEIELIETSTFTNGLYNAVSGGVINENGIAAGGDVTSHNGYQYAIYYTAETNNNSRRVAVSRRKEGDNNPWETFTFDNYNFTSDLSDDNGTTDGHNYATIDIATHDGTIHLAFDHHVDNLHYSVSVAGAATNPENHTWSSSLFSSITNKLSGISVNSITYPQFVRNNLGQLYFYHREGLPNGGAPNMYVYSLNGTWVKRGRIINGFSGNGSYNGSSSRNPYTMKPVVDSTGRIHVGWTFREQGNDNVLGSTNHDIHYMYSDDKGVTWYNTAGTHIGTSNSNPVTLNSPGIVVHQVGQARSLLNQYANLAVDNQNRPHMVYHFLPEELPDCTNVSGQAGPYYCPGAEYYHFALSGGQWQVIPTNIPVKGAGNVWVDQDTNDVFLGGQWNGRVYTATAASGWTDWQRDTLFDNIGNGDKAVWKERRELVSMDEVARTVTRHKVTNLSGDSIIEVQDGGFENPSSTLGGWGETSLVWNDTGTNPYELASFLVEGTYGGYMKNIGTITQDLNAEVLSGDTLMVSFYAGRNVDGKNTSGGGQLEATFIVDGSRYSMVVDTTLHTPGTYQQYSHEVTITNAGNLSLEFKRLTGKPWLDDISHVAREGEYIDTVAPVISLNGASNVSLSYQEVYVEQGATANDYYDGDVTSSLVITGSVDSSIPGTYSITYDAWDAAGNVTSTTRVVTVQEDVPPEVVNVVLPSNGGLLESFTGEYSSTWGAAKLTNGVTNEDGWASTANPSTQEFVYSFANGASVNLTDAVIHSGNGEGQYWAKDVEVWTSSDGSNYSLAASGVLANSSGQSITLDLSGIIAKKVKLVVTSGYRSDYWEIGEFELNGWQ